MKIHKACHDDVLETVDTAHRCLGRSHGLIGDVRTPDNVFVRV